MSLLLCPADTYHIWEKQITFKQQSPICAAERGYFVAEDEEDLLVKQLRYYTRFITVCLLLGKRDEVWEHLERLQQLVDDFSKEAQVRHCISCRIAVSACQITGRIDTFVNDTSTKR